MPKLGLYSAGWSVGGVTKFGASDFWRLAVPGRELRRNGWNVLPAREIQAAPDGAFILKDEHGGLHDDCEIIIWQRYMGSESADAIRRARATGQVVINDVDDYYWALPRSNMARRGTDPRRSKEYNREHYRDVIKASSLVTVSTPWLEKALERWGPPVTLVRNYVALDLWRARAPGDRVGWVGVIPWRGADLQLLAPTVIPWLRERGLPFYHAGRFSPGPRARDILHYENTIEADATEMRLYPRLWDSLRTALIPLDTSTFSQAKSWVKGLEACARGIPFIASDHPAYRELGVGRIARCPRDWTRHLDELEDPAVHAAECAANRARAEELSIANNWGKWDVVLREALRLADAPAAVA